MLTATDGALLLICCYLTLGLVFTHKFTTNEIFYKIMKHLEVAGLWKSPVGWCLIQQNSLTFISLIDQEDHLPFCSFKCSVVRLK